MQCSRTWYGHGQVQYVPHQRLFNHGDGHVVIILSVMKLKLKLRALIKLSTSSLIQIWLVFTRTWTDPTQKK